MSPAKTGSYSTDSGRPPNPATNMAGTSGSQPTPMPQCQQAPHERDDNGTLPRHPILTELQGDENPPRAEPTSSAYEPESPGKARKENPPENTSTPQLSTSPPTLSTQSSAKTSIPSTGPHVQLDDLCLSCLSTCILQGVNALLNKSRETELQILRDMHKLLNATAVKTNERDNALLNKLDKLGPSIATAISTEIRTVQANIEDLQTMNSGYALSVQELLQRISAAQNTTVQPAVDATTSTSADDSRFNPCTPPSLSPPLPEKDENPDGSEPPKGPDMPTTPVGRSNFRHPYYGRSPRPSQSPFSVPPR